MSNARHPITEEAQSKPTTELRREGRLFRIAKALASGATVTEIAEAEGISRTLASREANSPERRQLSYGSAAERAGLRSERPWA